MTETIKDCGCCASNERQYCQDFLRAIEKLDKVLGMHCNKGKCIACHFWFMTAMIYPDANLHPGWLVVDISSISLFVFWSNLRVSKAHTCTFKHSPTQERGLIAAGAKRVADVWRRFGGALLFLRLLLRQQPIPYPFGADCRGQRQSRSGFRRQLEANRQNGGHFGYMGATCVPDSHLDGLRTVCGLHDSDRGQELPKANCDDLTLLAPPLSHVFKPGSSLPTDFRLKQQMALSQSIVPLKSNGSSSFIIVFLLTRPFSGIPHFWTGPNSRVSPDRRSSSSCRRPQRSSCRVRSHRVLKALTE